MEKSTLPTTKIGGVGFFCLGSAPSGVCFVIFVVLPVLRGALPRIL